MAAVTELRRDYPLAALLKLAGIPRSTYYYHSRKANAVDKYAKERAEIIAIYQENQGRYGYRRIGMELRNRGFCLNHKTVQKLMKESGLKCMVRMKKYRSYRGEVGKIAPNLLARDFHAERPNQKWVTDVTEFSLFGSKLYLSLLCLTCIMVRSSAMPSVNGLITARWMRCWIKHSPGSRTAAG